MEEKYSDQARKRCVLETEGPFGAPAAAHWKLRKVLTMSTNDGIMSFTTEQDN